MSSPPTEYLRHMLTEAEYLVEKSRGLTREAFLNDETLQRAFVRSIEVIGEAAKHVTETFREAHPEIEWRSMAGMRDRLIHGYFGIDLELVWDVIESKIPRLRQQLIGLLR
jgi:uncharacterized protein with HEPN domain